MAMRYTRKLLQRLEEQVSLAHYTLRYETGRFQSADCKVHTTPMVVLNKHLSLEGKIELLFSWLQQQRIALPEDLRRLHTVAKK